MRKIATRVLLLAATVAFVSCGSANKEEKVIANPEATAALNIRYIDLDSINANYNLVKDFNEINNKFRLLAT